MITENSHLLAHHLPKSELRIYPDSGHGLLDQYPELFADHVKWFLKGGWTSLLPETQRRPAESPQPVVPRADSHPAALLEDSRQRNR